MKKFWGKIKEHPIASKVVAGLILAGLLAIINFFFSSIIVFASTQYVVSLWVLLVIGVAPIILILVVYFLYNRLEFLPEYGVYKHKKREIYFCVICKSPLQESENSWYCHKCRWRFDKLGYKPPNRRVISEGVKSNRMSRW